jgi:hypothetical protein
LGGCRKEREEWALPMSISVLLEKTPKDFMKLWGILKYHKLVLPFWPAVLHTLHFSSPSLERLTSAQDSKDYSSSTALEGTPALASPPS